MLILIFYLKLIFSLVSPVFAYEDFYQVRACCTYKGLNFDDIEYILIPSFNKHTMMEYNSTRGNWIGFSAYAVRAAKMWNNDPNDAIQRLLEMKLLCKDNQHFIHSIGNLTTQPIIKLKSTKQPGGKHPAMLVCSAYEFYPKQIELTWLRNGQEVTEGVSYSDAMSDGDLYFQIHSYLEYFPTAGEKITCVVQHFSLSEPKLVNWDDSLPVEGKIQIFGGLCVLMVGLVTLGSGVIYYRRRLPHAALSATEMIPGSEDSSSMNENVTPLNKEECSLS